MRRITAGALLGLLAIAELAARLSGGSTVPASLAPGAAPHAGVDPTTVLLMCALCMLATIPAVVLRPVAAAVAVGVGAAASLILFGLVTVAVAAALVLVAYRLSRGVSQALAVVLAAPFLALALAAAVHDGGPAVPAAGLSVSSAETRVLAVLLASAIPMAALAGMALRAREESRAHSAVRELSKGVLAEHLARGERARIARELHDVVAHHISMVAVQAETARLTTPGLNDAGAQRFAAIGDTARAGLTEMRRLLGVLREDAQAAAGGQATAAVEATLPAVLPADDPLADGLLTAAGQPFAERQPQPGLPQLAGLVDDARAASGCAARLIVSGPVARLDPGVELAAYRIVQEALTNARRHAPGAAVDVELRYADDVLWLHVRDNGPGSVPGTDAPGPLAGHGLLGMRERAAAGGGSLHAGNAPGGGFCVGAELPATVREGVQGAV